MRILTHHDVVRTLPMADCVVAMKQALIDLANGAYYLPLRLKAGRKASPIAWASCQRCGSPTTGACGR